MEVRWKHEGRTPRVVLRTVRTEMSAHKPLDYMNSALQLMETNSRSRWSHCMQRPVCADFTTLAANVLMCLKAECFLYVWRSCMQWQDVCSIRGWRPTWRHFNTFLNFTLGNRTKVLTKTAWRCHLSANEHSPCVATCGDQNLLKAALLIYLTAPSLQQPAGKWRLFKRRPSRALNVTSRQ